MVDVHVVGGGPAGLFAGIAALKKGLRVLVSEEHKEIGKPAACSGLVSRTGLEELWKKAGVDYRKAQINTIRSVKILCGGQSLSIAPKNESAVLISRSAFDGLAAEKFEQEGGKLELGKKVCAGFKADCVIGADGPASCIAERFGFPKIKSYVASMQGDYKFRCEDRHSVAIYLSRKDFPGFFGWVIPLDEETARVGLGVSLPGHHPLPYYKRFVSAVGACGKPENEFSAVIPIEARSITGKRVGKKCCLLVGDAAGQVKATTGGGVFFGSSCGMIAGSMPDEPEKYEREWRRAYGAHLLLHSLLRRAVNLAGGEPPRAAFLMAKALMLDELLARCGRMDRVFDMFGPSTLFSYFNLLAERIAEGGDGKMA